MAHRFHSLQSKLTLSYLLLLLVVSGTTFAYTWRETRSAMRDLVKAELTGIASVIAADLAPEYAGVIAGLRPGDEAKPGFLALRDRLARMRDANPDLKYVYVMRRSAGLAEFVVDADFGNAQDPGGAIGQVYYEATPALLRGFAEPSADAEPYTDSWGQLISGYAPIRDADGRAVGLVGADMLAERYLAKIHVVDASVIAVFALGLIATLVIMVVYSRTIARPIRDLNRAADAISTGNMQVEVSAATLRRKDEIGDLAGSFSRMVASLKIMMTDAADTKPMDVREDELVHGHSR